MTCWTYGNKEKLSQSALRIDARHYNAWYGLGMIYLRQEKFECSEHHFRMAFQINPRSSVIMSYLGSDDMLWWRSREKVVVPGSKPYITFQGAGREVTVIEWYDRACDRGANGQQLHTYQTAFVTVFASYFSARNISFKGVAKATAAMLRLPWRFPSHSSLERTELIS